MRAPLTTQRRRLVLATAVLVGLLSGAMLPAVADSFPDWSAPYSAKPGYGCSNTVWKDPVTVVFNGDEARAPNTARAVEQHLGWTNQDGGSQSLLVKDKLSSGSWVYLCNALDEQRANGGSVSTRKHIRLWRIPASSGDSMKVAATPHNEGYNILKCLSHFVFRNDPTDGSGFDQGRRSIQNGFSSHSQSTTNWGNTRSFQQCDGGWAGSNGTGVVISMGHLH